MSELTLLQKRFDQALHERRLSLSEAADLANLSRQSITRIRDGRPVHDTTIRKFARAIGESPAVWMQYAWASAGASVADDEADHVDASVSHIGGTPPSDPADRRALAVRLGAADAAGNGVEYDLAIVAAQQLLDANAGAYPITPEQARIAARELGINLVLIRSGRHVAGSTRTTVTVSGTADLMPRIIHEVSEALIAHSDRGIRHRAATIVERHYRRACARSADLTTTPDPPASMPASIRTEDDDWAG